MACDVRCWPWLWPKAIYYLFFYISLAAPKEMYPSNDLLTSFYSPLNHILHGFSSSSSSSSSLSSFNLQSTYKYKWYNVAKSRYNQAETALTA